MPYVYFGEYPSAVTDGNWNTVGNWYSVRGFYPSKGTPVPGVLLGRLPLTTESVVINSNLSTGPVSGSWTGTGPILTDTATLSAAMTFSNMVVLQNSSCITTGTFNGEVFVQGGSSFISGGIFNGPVVGHASYISGGTFNATTASGINSQDITIYFNLSGGTFNAAISLNLYLGSTLSGGTFNAPLTILLSSINITGVTFNNPVIIHGPSAPAPPAILSAVTNCTFNNTLSINIADYSTIIQYYRDSGCTYNGTITIMRNSISLIYFSPTSRYNPIATRTLSWSGNQPVITSSIIDPGFAISGGTFSPTYTNVGFSDALGSGML
jgi:hypothetical protein